METNVKNENEIQEFAQTETRKVGEKILNKCKETGKLCGEVSLTYSIAEGKKTNLEKKEG